MTFLRNDPNGISNYFDRLFAGIGHRGSSFTDVDGLVHDGRTNRFLFMEFKEAEESISQGQRSALASLARLPGVDVWLLRRLGQGLVEKSRPHIPEDMEVLAENKLQRRFAEWWNKGAVPIRQELCPHGNGLPSDCTWCWREASA